MLVTFGIVGLAEGEAGGDPAADALVFVGVGLHALAAAVGHAARRLEQQQALVGHRRVDAPAAGFLHQGVVVHVRLEAEQRDLEAVLPAGLAVAAAGIAPELGEDRHDLVAEIDRQVFLDALGLDGHPGGVAAVADRDLGFAAGQGQDAAAGQDAGDLLVGHLELGVAGEVGLAIAVQDGGDDQLLGGIASFEGDFLRMNDQLPDLGGLRRRGYFAGERFLLIGGSAPRRRGTPRPAQPTPGSVGSVS